MSAMRHPLPRWMSLHRWLGVGLGLWFVLVGLSGALLVWRDTVDAWLNPQWLRAQADGPALPIARVVEIAQGSHALGRIERVRPPAAAGEVYRLQVRSSRSRVEAGRIEAFIDPANGALLGVRSLESRSLSRADAMRLLYDFHRNILLGEPGSNFVGIAGFLLMASALSGAVLAWPRSREHLRRLLDVRWRANVTRLLFDLHRCTGVLIGVVLLLSTATGATLVYLNHVRDLVSQLSRVEPIPVLPFRASAGGQGWLPLEELVQRVEQGFPQRTVRELRFSERGLTGMQFYLRAAGDEHRDGDTIVWVHPVSGELLAERSDRSRSAGEAFMHWLLPLHVGSAFGTPGLVMMALAGVAPLLLAASGTWVHWRKRPGERLARQREAGRLGGLQASARGDRQRDP